MKKYLPLILLLLGALILLGAFFLVKGRRQRDEDSREEEVALLNVPIEERPVVSLTPNSDGHYLNLNIDNITIEAASLDYELLYQTSEGITQGVPGTVKLSGNDNFSTELLLGSESSGKFRYDEGVETGSITLRFRNEAGKLLAKFTSEFHLQTGIDMLTTVDRDFKYKLDKESSAFFVSMNTVGIPGKLPSPLVAGPYGMFSSSEEKIQGSVEIASGKVYYWERSNWVVLDDGLASDIGIFFVASD